eukprot:CAMPEP_0175793440 /NCGR_PEP_ID=MMETSP0097-20121207/83467_1 /TAXON_ID=311494 /ORGANISM="Alexandrium monilatum, Strain CCMP3105" /LENGTH=202 /DNA_ID=CAMNT_0017104627 /DNA_START=213 /DNA_END=822 /DNA_ORIENTATION=-
MPAGWTGRGRGPREGDVCALVALPASGHHPLVVEAGQVNGTKLVLPCGCRHRRSRVAPEEQTHPAGLARGPADLGAPVGQPDSSELRGRQRLCSHERAPQRQRPALHGGASALTLAAEESANRPSGGSTSQTYAVLPSPPPGALEDAKGERMYSRPETVKAPLTCPTAACHESEMAARLKRTGSPAATAGSAPSTMSFAVTS